MITEKELIQVVADSLGVEESSISIQSTTSDIPEWDSLGHIALLQDIEKTFEGRYRDPSKLASAVSIAELLKFLNET